MSGSVGGLVGKLRQGEFQMEKARVQPVCTGPQWPLRGRKRARPCRTLSPETGTNGWFPSKTWKARRRDCLLGLTWIQPPPNPHLQLQHFSHGERERLLQVVLPDTENEQAWPVLREVVVMRIQHVPLNHIVPWDIGFRPPDHWVLATLVRPTPVCPCTWDQDTSRHGGSIPASPPLG